MELGKYSFGIGDRFGHQGEAQLRALMKASEGNLSIVPVWNKSNREHTYIHSNPSDTRAEADSSVKSLNYKGQYLVDADHINMGNVQGFIDSSDFFTLDVASKIGSLASEEETKEFVFSCRKYTGSLSIPGIDHSFKVDDELLKTIARKFLNAAAEAGKIYQYIKEKKGATNFVTEVSLSLIHI